MEKEAFYQAVEEGEISYPVFVKPVKGSASINISKVDSREEIDLLFRLYDDLMIQEYMDGQEYGTKSFNMANSFSSLNDTDLSVSPARIFIFFFTKTDVHLPDIISI